MSIGARAEAKRIMWLLEPTICNGSRSALTVLRTASGEVGLAARCAVPSDLAGPIDRIKAAWAGVRAPKDQSAGSGAVGF